MQKIVILLDNNVTLMQKIEWKEFIFFPCITLNER